MIERPKSQKSLREMKEKFIFSLLVCINLKQSAYIFSINARFNWHIYTPKIDLNRHKLQGSANYNLVTLIVVSACLRVQKCIDMLIEK